MSSVHVYRSVQWTSHVLQGTRKTRPCSTCDPVQNLNSLPASLPVEPVLLLDHGVQLVDVVVQGLFSLKSKGNNIGKPQKKVLYSMAVPLSPPPWSLMAIGTLAVGKNEFFQSFSFLNGRPFKKTFLRLPISSKQKCLRYQKRKNYRLSQPDPDPYH